MSKNMHGFDAISIFFKRHITYISSENLLYRYFTGDVLQRVWSITGNVYYVPQFELLRFSCATINGNSSKRPTLEIFDHPMARYDVIEQIQRYVIEPVITCYTTLPSPLYNSSIGDLSLLLSTAVSDYTRIYGVIHYVELTCPGSYCQNTVKNVSASKGYRFSLTSHRGIIQERLLIERSYNETGFIAISNFSVRIHGLTHMPCHFGGLFIYELEPLTLVAKICTPWVAKAWQRAVKRINGTNGIRFNTKPVLFVLKSYEDKLTVQLKGFATISQCPGVVNAAFRDTTPIIQVSHIGEIMWLRTHRHAVRHAGGCFQLSHILTDANYLTGNQIILLMIYASGDARGNVANHTIEASLNADTERSLNTELVRSGFQNSSVVFRADWRSTRVPSCRIFDIDLGLLDANPFTSNESYVLSLLPGRRAYSIGFSAQCFVLGLNTVITMEYVPSPTHPCAQSEDVKRNVRTNTPGLSSDNILVTFPSLICGNIHPFYQSPARSLTTLLVFNNPSFKSVCCVLDLDIDVAKEDVPMLRSVMILEHYWFVTFFLTINRLPLLGKTIDLGLMKRYINLDLYTMFHRERLSTLETNYYKLDPIMNYWTCRPSPDCNRSEILSQLNENSSVHVTGQPWSVNTMTAGSAVLQIDTGNIDDTLHPMMNISFRFREWYSAVSTSPFPRFDRNPTWEYSYCHTAYGTCFEFYRKQISSWLEAEQFCQSEGMMLLSTPTNYEWEIITTLFARDPYVINFVSTKFLAFINLRQNKVSFPGKLHVFS